MNLMVFYLIEITYNSILTFCSLRFLLNFYLSLFLSQAPVSSAEYMNLEKILHQQKFVTVPLYM